uniref:Uncharacterized protein n=1 Tax=Arundo donax TaxID=35708 RepID=A0A0A9F9Y9_ARUDO
MLSHFIHLKEAMTLMERQRSLGH